MSIEAGKGGRLHSVGVTCFRRRTQHPPHYVCIENYVDLSTTGNSSGVSATEQARFYRHVTPE